MAISKISLLLLVSVFSVWVAAFPIDESKDDITKYENNNDGSGNYKFSFETSGGMTREETGRWVDKGQPGEHLEVEGEYSYEAPDGTIYIVKYISDLNGFRVTSVEQQEPPAIVAAVNPSVVASMLG